MAYRTIGDWSVTSITLTILPCVFYLTDGPQTNSFQSEQNCLLDVLLFVPFRLFGTVHDRLSTCLCLTDYLMMTLSPLFQYHWIEKFG
jgi:hypothetical protein